MIDNNPITVIIATNKQTNKQTNKAICLGNLGVGGQKGDVFRSDGLCCCESATQYKDPIKVLVRLV